MRWQHFAFMALIIVAAYWAGSKYPGLITKATMGNVSG
jgi:hypothetical protein